MGIKGNLSEINAIPFAAPPLAPVRPGYDPKTEAVGVGYTQGSAALSLCTAAHSLYTIFANIFGASVSAISETTVRPNPRYTPEGLDQNRTRRTTSSCRRPRSRARRRRT
jgi:hypothetical protein